MANCTGIVLNNLLDKDMALQKIMGRIEKATPQLPDLRKAQQLFYATAQDNDYARQEAEEIFEKLLIPNDIDDEAKINLYDTIQRRQFAFLKRRNRHEQDENAKNKENVIDRARNGEEPKNEQNIVDHASHNNHVDFNIQVRLIKYDDTA
ncbi:hypothetical protein ACJ73_07330 [Blastomyces percursus]|uniref:Uncharacterized protein n=1 Tax=Blastomyces percursus TaxID=1658174 RepID=A0A1J9QMC2_9EURO|nr:hypothetical protein ACJ73_07330 [Blastomyces percursus]